MITTPRLFYESVYEQTEAEVLIPRTSAAISFTNLEISLTGTTMTLTADDEPYTYPMQLTGHTINGQLQPLEKLHTYLTAYV